MTKKKNQAGRCGGTMVLWWCVAGVWLVCAGGGGGHAGFCWCCVEESYKSKINPPFDKSHQRSLDPVPRSKMYH
jgi:hypothetical protein